MAYRACMGLVGVELAREWGHCGVWSDAFVSKLTPTVVHVQPRVCDNIQNLLERGLPAKGPVQSVNIFQT